MPAEEVEAYDVQEIQQDSDSIADDINDVDKALQSFVVDDAWRETIENDVQQVDGENDGQVKLHPIEIKCGSLPYIQLMEKLDVEQIEHPAADAERHQSG